MKSSNAFFAFVFSLCWVSQHSLAREPLPQILPALQKHCLRCHGQGDELEGDVDLKIASEPENLLKQPELIEKMITVLVDRQMPPEDEPAISEPLHAQMVEQLRDLLKRSLQSAAFKPIPMRRMNRFQYNNAVVDLLDLDRDLFRLNERLIRRRNDYLRPETGKMPDEIRVSCRPLSKDIDGQRPEGFRGVAAYPQDKRAEHGFDNRADHLTLSPLLMESFLKLSQSIVGSPDLNAKECGYWSDIFAQPELPGPTRERLEAEGPELQVDQATSGKASPQNMSAFAGSWSGNHQLFWACEMPSQQLNLTFESKHPSSGLILKLTTAADYGKFRFLLDGKPIGVEFDSYSSMANSHDVEFNNVAVNAGKHTLSIKNTGKNEQSSNYFFGLDYIQLAATSKTKEPTALLTESDVVRHRLRKLLRRAFRQPVDDETLDEFTALALGMLDQGTSFEQSMRTVVSAIIAMPEFLYFYESGEPQPDESSPVVQPVTDFELATRLAQFFWSSIPDDELLDLAERGKLSDSATLSLQIDRMLNDRKMSRFCDNFPAQWLQLDRLITAIPDPKKYPYFYYAGYRTSMHMMSEPLLLFETVLVENRSIIDLINPDFTWETPLLRSNYEGQSAGPHDVNVQHFRRVSIDTPRRGGVITNAAIMTMTSTSLRTQPITRGAWVNAVIFNDPPEPPPADVPPLDESDHEALAKLTIRERLAMHRQRADCAGCHNKIDPLGFALENFGPTGVWRETYENSRQVDVSGVLFNQYPFSSLAEFKQLIVEHRHRFVRGFTAHLLSYALGRELGPADSPTLDAITQRAIGGEDQLRAVLKQIATSEPFKHKTR